LIKNNIKKTGLKAAVNGRSTENNTENIYKNEIEIQEEDLRPRNILIDYDTYIKDLRQDLLQESYEITPREITMYVVDAREISIKDIESLSKMINNRNLIVNLFSVGNIDFTELTLFGLCVTGEVNFSDGSLINMDSLTSIPKDVLKRIAKKISKRTGVEAKTLIKFYKNKATVCPCEIFIA